MIEQKGTNICWHEGKVTRADRERLNGHRGFTIWFTGLSAPGKSTLAVATEEHLYERGYHAYILDGDNIRHGLSKEIATAISKAFFRQSQVPLTPPIGRGFQGINRDLGFSSKDRTENIRRIGDLAKILRDCGIINMTAFISPYGIDRQAARRLSNDNTFIEVFADCPVEICEQRDPKRAYRKARGGIIKEFTGVRAPYEAPENPEIHLHTDKMSIEKCVQLIRHYLVEHEYIRE